MIFNVLPVMYMIIRQFLVEKLCCSLLEPYNGNNCKLPDYRSSFAGSWAPLAPTGPGP